MVSNKKVTGKALSMPAGLGLGLAVSVVLTIVIAVVITYLLLGEKIPESAIGYGSMAILLLSSALGALIAAGTVKRRWMVVCLAAGGLYFLTLLGITAMFFGGQYQGMGVSALLILAGSGAVGLLGLRGERGVGKRHKKYRPR